MRAGDVVLVYHSMTEKAVVGVAHVVTEAYPDPTSPANSPWLAVDLEAVRGLVHPVKLAAIRADARLATIGLLRQTQLSVMPLETAQAKALLELGGSIG